MRLFRNLTCIYPRHQKTPKTAISERSLCSKVPSLKRFAYFILNAIIQREKIRQTWSSFVWHQCSFLASQQVFFDDLGV